VYFATSAPDSTSQAFYKLSKRLAKSEPSFFYEHRDIGAIAHLFSVSSGLDSMVLGEEQIIEQVRDAGISERVSGHSKAILSSLFDASYSVGRRVRSRLSGRVNASVSAFALKLALKKLGHQPRKSILIGTGKTIRLASKELADSETFVVTARESLPPTLSNVRLIRRDEIRKFANDCDLIISATKHAGYLLRVRDLSDEKTRVVLDLAFPRNIDPRLRELRSTYLYNLDDLASKAGDYPSKLLHEKEEAKKQVLKEAGDFKRWLLASRLSAHLSTLCRWSEGVRRTELEVAINRLPDLSERERRIITALSKRLMSKILSKPTQFAKASGDNISQPERLRLVEKVFMLEKEPDESG
jgi:glutamyl-tRNA reductase